MGREVWGGRYGRYGKGLWGGRYGKGYGKGGMGKEVEEI